MAHKLDKNWLKICNSEGAVILSGPMGTGKTAWALMQVYKYRQKRKPAVLVSMIEMIAQVKHSWNRGEDYKGPTEFDLIKKYQELDLLVVDEIGVQWSSAAERNILYEILIKRYDFQRPTIMTTNLDIGTIDGREELVKCIGARIFDRIGNGWVDCSKWPRLRGKK